jgi:AcrR family transcriptional regulator
MKAQQRKSGATREPILKATVQSLIEAGFVATTFERVARTSQQSRGAITYHFPSREMLIRETLRYIQTERIAIYRAAMVDQERELVGFERSVEIYWETFCDPLHVAYQEVVSQARTDRHLAAFLIPMNREFEAEWDRVVLGLHPDWANSVELFRRTRTIATFLMDGMSRERLIFGADEEWLHSIRQDLKAWMRHMLVAERGASAH